jgi:hypothetical protein
MGVSRVVDGDGLTAQRGWKSKLSLGMTEYLSFDVRRNVIFNLDII